MVLVSEHPEGYTKRNKNVRQSGKLPQVSHCTHRVIVTGRTGRWKHTLKTPLSRSGMYSGKTQYYVSVYFLSDTTPDYLSSPTPLVVYSEMLSLPRGQLPYITTKKIILWKPPLSKWYVFREDTVLCFCLFSLWYHSRPPTTRTPYPSLLFLSTNCRKLIVLAYSVTIINST